MTPTPTGKPPPHLSAPPGERGWWWGGSFSSQGSCRRAWTGGLIWVEARGRSGGGGGTQLLPALLLREVGMSPTLSVVSGKPGLESLSSPPPAFSAASCAAHVPREAAD